LNSDQHVLRFVLLRRELNTNTHSLAWLFSYIAFTLGGSSRNSLRFYNVSQKRLPFLIFNNSVNTDSISIIFGVQYAEEIAQQKNYKLTGLF